MRVVRIIALLAAGVVLTVPHALGQHNTAETRASLQGLRGVCVKIHYFGPPERKYGLTPQQLKDAVELRFSIDSVKC